MTPEESQRVREILRGKFAEREPVSRHEGRHIHRDGHVVWVELNAMPIFDSDGVFKGYRGIMQCISGRNRPRSPCGRARRSSVLCGDGAAVAILVYQGEQYVYANPTAEKITGYGLEELQEMKFWDVMHPDDREMVRERGMARQQGATVPPRYEVRYRTKGGKDGVFEINASANQISTASRRDSSLPSHH